MDSSWLSVLREDMRRTTPPAARRHWPGPSQADPPFFHYRWEHVQQVERDARRLLQSVTADEEIVLAAVWLHDRFQPQYDDDGHTARAADWARSHQAGCGFPPARVAVVAGAVAEHSGAPGTIPEDRLEARLHWDADKLSRLGAVNLVSHLAAMPAFPSQLMGFDPGGRESEAVLQTGIGRCLLLRRQPASCTTATGMAGFQGRAARRDGRVRGRARMGFPDLGEERRGNALPQTAIPR